MRILQFQSMAFLNFLKFFHYFAFWRFLIIWFSAALVLGGWVYRGEVEFWDELPRSPVGKVLKKEVRKKFWAGIDRKI